MWEERSYFEEFTGSDIKKLILNAGPDSKKKIKFFVVNAR